MGPARPTRNGRRAAPYSRVAGHDARPQIWRPRGRVSRPVQPGLIRLTHWANLVLLALMAGSGLRILVAYPYLGAQGAEYGWYPLQGMAPPAALTVGGWLAGARHWHFAFAWLFVANAAIYLAYLFASGEWRRRLFFPRRDARNAWVTLLHDLHLRKEAPPSVGLYNGMQRLSYTGVVATAPLLVLSGLAMYKPVQLPRLTALLGGYDAARAIHLLVLAALALFTLVHVAQVLRHPRTLADMTVGRAGRPEEGS
jgi:thiosulfate reductase cytochrome b subunit